MYYCHIHDKKYVEFKKSGNIKKSKRTFDAFIEDNKKLFIGQPKANVNENMIHQLPEEYSPDTLDDIYEGAKIIITVNAYERNSKARKDCLDYWGTNCFICNFDFESRYGKLGKGFIHVHHVVPISQIGITYKINPVKDLRPVCPNCHAMLHRSKIGVTIEELKEMLLKQE